MKAVIFEDEPLASERLRLLLKEYDHSVRLAASLESIEEAVRWLGENPSPDLIFSDIQLSDGSAFEIFQQVKITVPVIFITAYDKYALDAFKLLSIDYLLKPVTIQALSNAMDKLKQLNASRSNSLAAYDDLIKLLQQKLPHYKTRFTGKMGNKLFFIEAKEIAFFYSDNKIVYLMSKDNARYIVEYTLEHLEDLLDPSVFFRINRSLVVNIHAISQVRPYENNRLQILLRNNIKPEGIIVSRDRVVDFRKWTDN
jgi:DNA-binding LytR/AlgR family response regulator